MESEQPPQQILPPNIDKPGELEAWINKYITKPSVSFNDPNLTHPDGRPLTPQERLDKTREQIIMAVNGLRGLKKPSSAIKGYLLSHLSPVPPVNDKP
ncbi:hypothetical protein HYU93_03325 [Candidatus Daviesbacteria bacterium]|nr:hypothetical protein [Candidatus Daviesbacteria bacterium]